jgi:hypothetical protein
MTRQLDHASLLACSLLLTCGWGSGCDDDHGSAVIDIDASQADPDGEAPDGGAGDGDVVLPDGAVTVVGDTWGYTSGQRLVKFARATGKLERSLAVSGLGDETVLGVDIRPASGAITVLTNLALYTLDSQTGALGERRVLAADPADTSSAFSGSLPIASAATPPAAIRYGVDFNPVVDRLRVVSSTGVNLRINPNNGLVITDPLVAPLAPIAAAAYANSLPSDCGTKLYVIDASARQLLLQDPTAATLSEAKSLGDASIGEIHGLDIVTDAAGQNVGLVAASAGDGERVYELNLTTFALGTPQVVALASGERLQSVFASVPVPSGELWGTTESNKLITFHRMAPGKLCTNVAMSGLSAGDEVLAAAVRPADKKLYGVTRAGKLIQIAVPSGVVTSALELSAAGGDDAPFTLPISGTEIGLSFHPANDELRMVTDTGANLRIDPDDGKVTTDTAITAAVAPVSGSFKVTDIAYTNASGVVPATATTLWALESEGDQLVRIGGEPADAAACPTATNPSCGVYTVVKALGFGASIVNGFDVEPKTGVVLAALTDTPTATASTLFSINLAGDATAMPSTVSKALGIIGGTDRAGGAESNLLRSLSFAPKP